MCFKGCATRGVLQVVCYKGCATRELLLQFLEHYKLELARRRFGPNATASVNLNSANRAASLAADEPPPAKKPRVDLDRHYSGVQLSLLAFLASPTPACCKMGGSDPTSFHSLMSTNLYAPELACFFWPCNYSEVTCLIIIVFSVEIRSFALSLQPSR